MSKKRPSYRAYPKDYDTGLGYRAPLPEPVDLSQPKVKAGRPKLVINLGAVASFAEAGQTPTEICRSLGVPESTWKRKLREDPTLRQTIRAGRARGSYPYLMTLKANALKGRVGSIRLIMERLELDD